MECLKPLKIFGPNMYIKKTLVLEHDKLFFEC